jgi:hypothetical protein
MIPLNQRAKSSMWPKPLGSDFPSALLRFGMALGIQMNVCPPHHLQDNGFVERYHRTYQEECLNIDRPRTLEQARRATETFLEHYNTQRPNQARSCGNRPPCSAFPALPTLARPPAQIAADAWLRDLDGMHIERKVDAHGMVHLDLRSYYVDQHRAGQRVTLQIQAASQSLGVWHEGMLLKALPLKGLTGGRFSFERFVAYMAQQARAQHRLRSFVHHRGSRFRLCSAGSGPGLGGACGSG